MSRIDQQTTPDPKFLGSCCGAVIFDSRTAFTSDRARHCRARGWTDDSGSGGWDIESNTARAPACCHDGIPTRG